MVLAIKRNKFPFGSKQHFVNIGTLTVPIQAGIHFNVSTLDPEIGQEVVLVLTENKEFLIQLRKQGPFQLRLNAGGVNTSAGPIVFMLWWFPPLINERPFAGYELLVSPKLMLTGTNLLEEASRQTHLHLVILDERQEIFDIVEFENVYELGRLVEMISQISPTLHDYDFHQAKEAFMREIPQESLL